MSEELLPEHAEGPAPPAEPGRIDVVVPTHGRPAFLAEALDSVSRQTALPAQVIVVSDDGDPRTCDVVSRFAAEHPGLPCRYLDRTAGAPGASASRNLGALQGESALLAFLDDDDLWEPTYLSSARSRLVDGSVDAVVTCLRRFSAAGDGPLMLPRSGLTARDVFRSSPSVTGSSLVVRRSVFHELGGFDPELPVQNDRDFFLRLVGAGHPYAVVADPLVRLRRHDEGRLTDPSGQRADGILLFLAKHGAHFSRWDRRVVRYLSHRTRMSSAPSPAALARSAFGALLNWSPTAAAQVPLGPRRLGELRAAARRVAGGSRLVGT